MEGEPPKIYTRRKWLTLGNEPYYSWDQNELPNWFSAPKTFWNEARRNKLISERRPEHIYHYTSIEGFFGIVKSRTLWLSDYCYLNDKRELTHGIDLVQEVAAQLLKHETRQVAIDLLGTWIQDIAKEIHRVCIASFSAEGDSLSQWRSYGQVAVGFEPRDVSLHAYGTNLQPVEYDRDRQRALVQTYLHHLREAYVVDFDANRLERITDVYHKTDRLIELVAFFKDPAFRSEKEYRLAYIENPQILESLGIEAPTKRFRVNRTKILPYIVSSEIEPSSANTRPLAIKEVVLGPETDDLLERGVRELLQSESLGEVIVRRSTVPYRT